jgi:hypothetical protein
MRKTLVAVTALAVAAALVVATVTMDRDHHGGARPASIVHTLLPAAATAPAPTPSAAFDADTFLNALTHVDGNTANELIDALSPADRAALATDVKDHIGVAVR